MILPRSTPAVVLFLVVGVVFLVSPVRVPTDSLYSPLVSEALLRHGSLALDPWFPARDSLPYQVEKIGGHVYSWYPPGGPVLATPLVGLLSWFGLSAAGSSGSYDVGRDVIVQALLAALLMAMLTVLFYSTAREVLPPRWSWLVALGAALGTQIWTTASRALWGDTFLALLLGMVTWLLVRHESGRRPLSPVWLATLLAWSYFCRPTASVAVVAVTIYLGRYHRRLLIPYLATGLGWLAAFVIWSWLTFGSPLPTYYRMSAFSFRTFASGLLGILISPSRGQLVFVPVTVFIGYLGIRYRRSLPLPRLLGLTLIAMLGHLALIAVFPLWHGGHCYGPRYLTPLVPWLVLLAALGLRALLDRRGPWMRWELGAGALLLVLSVLIQARGAFVRETWIWNAVPDNISVRPERVWSWRDAQFLAGLMRPAMPLLVPTYALGTRIDLASSQAERYLVPGGWSGPEGSFRWTDGRTAEMVFAVERVEPLLLEVELEPFLPRWRARQQRIDVELNGQRIGSVAVDRPGAQEVSLVLPGVRLARTNRLTFHLRDATFASPFGLGKDPRQLAVAVHWWRMRSAS
jgi:hypothetical protein